MARYWLWISEIHKGKRIRLPHSIVRTPWQSCSQTRDYKLSGSPRIFELMSSLQTRASLVLRCLAAPPPTAFCSRSRCPYVTGRPPTVAKAPYKCFTFTRLVQVVATPRLRSIGAAPAVQAALCVYGNKRDRHRTDDPQIERNRYSEQLKLGQLHDGVARAKTQVTPVFSTGDI